MTVIQTRVLTVSKQNS